jgi:hypothetical protein
MPKEEEKVKDSILYMVSRQESPGKIVIDSISDGQAREIVNAIKAKVTTLSNRTESSEPSGNGNSLPSMGCDAFNISVKPEGFSLRSPGKNGTNRAVGPHGTPYEEVLSVAYENNAKITAYKKVTPIKIKRKTGDIESDRYIAFDAFSPGKKVKTQQKYPGLFNKPTKFEFTVTPKSIKKRKRERTQRKAVGNSAKNILKLLGATTKEREGRGSHYHLGHEQGHCLGGREIIENLDICTEGANNTLLAYIENPIYRLIALNQAESAVVKGLVHANSVTGIVERIHYTVIFFPNGTQCTKQINLFDYRKPTLSENNMAMAILSHDPSRNNHSSGTLVNNNVVSDENTPEAANRPPMEWRLF